MASRPVYSTENAHAYILPRGRSVSRSMRRRSGVLRVELPLALTMPPSKVHPLCKAKIRQKVCKPCISSQKKSRANAYYWRMRYTCSPSCHTRVCRVFAHALYMHKAPRVLHFSAFHFLCRTMASTAFTLKREATSTGIKHNEPNLAAAWLDIGDTMMVSETLQGHEETLFKRHLSFKGASEVMAAPRMSKGFALKRVLAGFDLDKLKTLWESQQAQLIEGLYLLKYGNDDVTGGTADEHNVGAPYLQGLLRLLVPGFPVVSFTELSLECRSKKKIVGGRLDLGVGSKSTGIKPSLVIEGYEDRVALYLGCLGEAKSADVSLAHCKNTEHQVDLDDIKATLQPMLEVMAVAEIAQCTTEAVPLVNILANKNAFRPFLNWQEKDVLLTTGGAVPLRRSQSERHSRTTPSVRFAALTSTYAHLF